MGRIPRPRGYTVNEPTLLDLIPRLETMSRADDPATSKRGAIDAHPRVSSQKIALLTVYARAAADGLTDEEAGDASGLSANRRCCYWKRCSELRQAGFIAPAGERLSSAGSAQRVCRITDRGREILEFSFTRGADGI